jgi:hypothetical protein
MSWRDVLGIDRDHALPNRTWWWWWFIFFFRNEANPDRTKQMVILWGTRNCRKLVVNDHVWHHDGGVVEGPDGLAFEGITAGWYYDGVTMRDPLFVDDGRMRTEWAEGGGTLRFQDGGTALLDATRRPYRLRVDRPEVAVDLSLDHWTDALSGITPTGKTYLRHLGYTMHKIRGSRVRGTVAVGGAEEEVVGTAYFQKVRINSPTSPWYWGVFQTGNASYIDYFMPHVGPPALRRSADHRSPWDWGERPLSRSFQFLDGEDGTLHRIRNVRIERRYADDLPVFRLRGREAGREVDMVMEAYARAYWKIEQPFLGLFRSVLYYNEYPVNVTRFAFRDGGKVVRLEDLGRVVGNCEHAWGMV